MKRILMLCLLSVPCVYANNDVVVGNRIDRYVPLTQSAADETLLNLRTNPLSCQEMVRTSARAHGVQVVPSSIARHAGVVPATPAPASASAAATEGVLVARSADASIPATTITMTHPKSNTEIQLVDDGVGLSAFALAYIKDHISKLPIDQIKNLKKITFRPNGNSVTVNPDGTEMTFMINVSAFSNTGSDDQKNLLGIFFSTALGTYVYQTYLSATEKREMATLSNMTEDRARSRFISSYTSYSMTSIKPLDKLDVNSSPLPYLQVISAFADPSSRKARIYEFDPIVKKQQVIQETEIQAYRINSEKGSFLVVGNITYVLESNKIIGTINASDGRGSVSTITRFTTPIAVSESILNRFGLVERFRRSYDR